MGPASSLGATSLAMLVGFYPVVTAQACIASIIEQAPESTVVNGYVVNNRSVAVQKDLSARPPTHDELGVTIPAGSRLEPGRTARQIAQCRP